MKDEISSKNLEVEKHFKDISTDLKLKCDLKEIQNVEKKFEIFVTYSDIELLEKKLLNYIKIDEIHDLELKFNELTEDFKKYLLIKDFDDKLHETTEKLSTEIETKTKNKEFLKFCERNKSTLEEIHNQVRSNK